MRHLYSLSIALVTNPVTRSPFSEEQSAAISNRSRSSRHMASLTGFGRGCCIADGNFCAGFKQPHHIFLSFVVIGLTFCRDATSHLFPNSLRWLLALHYRVGRPLVPKVLFTLFFPRLLGCSVAAMLPKQARETFRKHIAKSSEQVAAPPSRWLTRVMAL